MKIVAWIAGAIMGIYALAAIAETGLVFGRPPQPLALGTVQWFYEVGTTVDSVERRSQIGTGAHAVHAKGEFYIVHARILAPFGLRPTWDDRYVEVRTFAGNGATMPAMRFAVDEAAQSVLDRQTGRPGPRHLVRGAQQREDLVFEQSAAHDRRHLLSLLATAPFQRAVRLAPHPEGPRELQQQAGPCEQSNRRRSA